MLGLRPPLTSLAREEDKCPRKLLAIGFESLGLMEVT